LYVVCYTESEDVIAVVRCLSRGQYSGDDSDVIAVVRLLLYIVCYMASTQEMTVM